MLGCESVPSDRLACGLFIYRGNLVAVDLFGAGIPILLCLIFSVYLLSSGHYAFRPHRLMIYTALTVGLGLAAAGEYTAWDSVYGGLSINTRVILYSLILPVGALAFLLLDRARRPRLAVLQTYMVGTIGTILSDLFRTFSGALNVSPQIIGAAGPIDGVFLNGMFMVMSYLATAVIYISYSNRNPKASPTKIGDQD